MRVFLDKQFFESGRYLVQYSSWSTGKTVDLQSINLLFPKRIKIV